MLIRSTLSRPVCLAAITLALLAAPVSTGWAQEVETPAIDSMAAATEPPAFETVEMVVEAFKQALETPDTDALAALLGLDAAKLKADENAAETYAAIQEGAARQVVVDGEGDRRILEIGNKLWPLPFPLVKVEDGKWAFDTFAGLEEIVNRRVGENELQAIATMRAYVDAQQDYASEDRDGDGVLEYAQKLISTEGENDGLYWPTDDINGVSPAGDGIDRAELDKSKAGEGYFGYKFRILTAQGSNIAGGAYDYVINGNMIGGFALIAWPATYAQTGVNTFVVNQHGVVYQTDLGEATAQIVKYIDSFNPDDTWETTDD